MSQDSIERTLGVLLGKVEGIEEGQRHAAEGRSAIHRRLDEIVMRTTYLETDVLATKNKVEAMAEVTEAVVRLRERALGAGTLGRWLLWIGGGVLTVGGWAVAAYTWITGRPPP